MWKITSLNAIKQLENVLLSSDSDLALIGVKPTYPSSKYGYIIPTDEKHPYRLIIKRFPVSKKSQRRSRQKS